MLDRRVLALARLQCSQFITTCKSFIIVIVNKNPSNNHVFQRSMINWFSFKFVTSKQIINIKDLLSQNTDVDIFSDVQVIIQENQDKFVSEEVLSRYDVSAVQLFLIRFCLVSFYLVFSRLQCKNTELYTCKLIC